MHHVHDKERDWSMRFNEFTFLERGNNLGDDVFGVGYTTTEIDKILKCNSDPVFEWLNDNKSGFKFMGASWYNYPKRHPKPRSADDQKAKRVRLPSRAPYGFEYIAGCIFHDDKGRHNGDMMSEDVDFSKARLEFKTWVEARTQVGLAEPTEIVICVKDGVIGIWYEPVRNANGEYIYNADQALVKIGTTEVAELKGQWRVSVDRIRRVWGLLASGWSLYIPHLLEDVALFKEPNLDFDGALDVLNSESEDQPYGHMQNLCSTSEHDDCLFEVANSEAEDEHWVARLCIPLVLRCNTLWVYLYSKTD